MIRTFSQAKYTLSLITSVAILSILLAGFSYAALAVSAEPTEEPDVAVVDVVADEEEGIIVAEEAMEAEVLENEDVMAKDVYAESAEYGSVLFIADNIVRVSDATARDVLATGYQILIDAPAGGDVFAAAQDVDISAPVQGSLRAAASSVRVNNRVEGSAWIAASSITVSEAAELVRGANIYAGSVVFNGATDGPVHIAGGIVSIGDKAQFNGDVLIEGEDVIFESGMNVSQSIEVRSNQEPTIEEGVIGVENISFTQVDSPKAKRHLSGDMNAFFQFQLIFAIYSFLAAGVLALFGVLIFPNHFTRIAQRIKDEPAPVIGFGAVGVMIAPLVLFAVALTVFGIPAALFFATVLVLCAALSKMYVGVYLMHLILKFDLAKTSRAKIYGYGALGYVAIVLVGLIPFIGWLVEFAIVVVGTGAVLYDTWKRRLEF